MRPLLHRLVLRPAARWLTEFRVEHAERLPERGPAIVVANHNSHIDTGVLLAAFPSRAVLSVRPVAAADYWFRNRAMRWFSRCMLGAVPIDRSGTTADPLAEAAAALRRGEIIVLFPEGTRGEPGVLGRFHCGVARLASMCPDAVVVPVWLDGCSQVLPRHGRLPQRCPCTVRVGEALRLEGRDPRVEADELRQRVAALA
jgi:1-acyl-sn-glycerol-3-phosphate acyltransferase